MGKIYAMARRSHVWLGPATDKQVDAVRPLFDAKALSSLLTWEFINQRYFLGRRDYRKSHTTTNLSALADFTSRAWFTRRWVLQEVALSRKVIIHCGDHTVPWAWFCDRVDTLWESYNVGRAEGLVHERETETMHILDNIIKMDLFRKEVLGDLDSFPSDESIAHRHLLELLDTYHTTDCVDERDRLYSLYGLLPTSRTEEEQNKRLIVVCPVDYNQHFTYTYANFASASIRSGLSHKILEHAIGFGGLGNHQESWPSWVPNWHMKKQLKWVGRCLDYLRAPLDSPETRSYHDLWTIATDTPWKEDNPTLSYVKGSLALTLHGCLHRISDTQSSTGQMDAISFFETTLRRHYAFRDSIMSRYEVSWVMTLAIQNIPGICFRTGIDLPSVFSPVLDRLRRSQSGPILWTAIKIVFGLQSGVYADLEKFTPDIRRILGMGNYGVLEATASVDEVKFASEARRLLQGYEAFCYGFRGSLKFGIAFAQAKPGDYVFRTTGAARSEAGWARGVREFRLGDHLASAFGLIIRPYHHPDAPDLATFRLVGMCLDYCPDVEDSQIVEVVLV